MGVFILCWLPFFVTNILMGICPDSCITDPDLVGSIVTWLGWLNSGMNPIIYACWSREFRKAFDKILFGSCCKKRRAKRKREEMVNRIRWNRDRFKESTSNQSTANCNSKSSNYSTKDGLKRNLNIFADSNYFPPGVIKTATGSIMSSNCQSSSSDKDYIDNMASRTIRINDDEDEDEEEALMREMIEKQQKRRQTRANSIAATFREPLVSATHASICAISIAEVVMDRGHKK